MAEEQNRPRVGLGIIIVDAKGQILVGKRKGDHAPFFALPGGHLELGERFETGAIREIKEETNLDIVNPTVIAVTNNLVTYAQEGRHSISIILLTTEFSGELQTMEPDKSEGWFWVNPKELPAPIYESSRLAVTCYLTHSFYP